MSEALGVSLEDGCDGSQSEDVVCRRKKERESTFESRDLNLVAVGIWTTLPRSGRIDAEDAPVIEFSQSSTADDGFPFHNFLRDFWSEGANRACPCD